MSEPICLKRLWRRVFGRGLTCVAVAAFISQAAGQQQDFIPPELSVPREPRAMLHFGNIDFHPTIASALIYDDNITISSANRIDDIIYVLSPGLHFLTAESTRQAGLSMSLDYSPAFVFFVDRDEFNSIDHDAKFNGGFATAKLTLGVRQEFQTVASGVADVGSRVNQTYYRTIVDARYEVSEKTSLRLGGGYHINEYESLIGSTEWTEDNSVHYQITPKVDLGLGLTVGQLFVDQAEPTQTGIIVPGTNSVPEDVQTYLTPSLRAGYKTTEKTDVALSVGVEWRNYSDGSDSIAPVFSLTGTYRPWDTTTVILEAHRRQQNSAVLAGENYISTGGTLGVRQKIFDRLFGHLSVTYDNVEYQPTRQGVSSSRRDDYFLIRYGAEVIILRSWAIGVFHLYKENISSSDIFSFDNNQVGLQATWSF